MKRNKPRRVSNDRQIEPGEDQEKDSTIDSGAEDREGVSRRRFLIGGTGMAAAAIIAGDSLVEAQRRRPGSGQGGRGGGGGQGAGQGAGRGGGGGARPHVPSALNLSTSATSPPFAEPKVVTPRAVNGRNVLSLTLNTEMTNWQYQCDGQVAYAAIPIFNQDVPGPTMMVDPGTTLNLVLNNNLPTKSGFDDPCEAGGMSGMSMSKQVVSKPSETQPECFMHTNLHFHGLFASPCSLNQDGTTHCGPLAIDGKNPPLKSSSDDVLLDIYPGQSNNYCVVLPDFHDPGTYWYHSHVHGSSAYQVASGMAGAIIIREPAGEEIVPSDRDHVFLMQEVIFNPPSPPAPKPPKNIPLVYQEKSTTEGSAGFLINGQCKPTLQIKTGQNYRWRFINGTGTPRGLMKLRLIKMSDNPRAVVKDSDIFTPGQDPVAPAGQIILPVKKELDSKNAYMHLIAVDGLTFYGFSPQPVKRHLMAPGNRADFIINIPKTATTGAIGGPGKYVLVKDCFPKDAVSFDLQPTLDCSQANQIVVAKTVPASLRTNQVLAYIEVYPGFTTEPLPTLPKTRPFNLQPIASVDNSANPRLIDFQGIGGGAAGGGGGAGGGNFFINCKVYDPQSPGIVAQLNTAEEWELRNYGATDFPHPFHIHVNPFQIKGRTIDFETDKPTLDPNNPCNWIWQDTVAIPASIDITVPPFTAPKVCPPQAAPAAPAAPAAAPAGPVPCPSPPTPPNKVGSVTLRTRFLVYPGEYVIHCHILIHEDVGMMSNVTIEDPNKAGIGPCVPAATPPQASVDCINRTKPKSNC